MPFDPSKPADESVASAAELREQLNALKAMIDAVNARIDALPTGYVTQQQLNDAVNGVTANSSGNTNSVATMDFTVSEPPTQWEVGTILNTMNATLQAMRRI
ncbi:MAG: hypothetical protein WCO56_12450 [Verrucomicrobiota bacterium]